MSTFADRLEIVKTQIRAASPFPEKVTLISVSKTKPMEALLEAYSSGVRVFGENRVQEARDKRPQLPEDAEIHLIGPLQKNKSKYCPDLFSWVHTIHRLDVAEELNLKCEKKNKVINILVQMNLTGEETKSGLRTTDELQTLNDQLVGLPNLKIRGLMTMGDPALSPEGNRVYFSQLREIQQAEQKRMNLGDYDQLSMGMSGDFEEALKEGATMIRVGSALFGSRS